MANGKWQIAGGKWQVAADGEGKLFANLPIR